MQKSHIQPLSQQPFQDNKKHSNDMISSYSLTSFYSRKDNPALSPPIHLSSKLSPEISQPIYNNNFIETYQTDQYEITNEALFRRYVNGITCEILQKVLMVSNKRIYFSGYCMLLVLLVLYKSTLGNPHEYFKKFFSRPVNEFMASCINSISNLDNIFRNKAECNIVNVWCIPYTVKLNSSFASYVSDVIDVFPFGRNSLPIDLQILNNDLLPRELLQTKAAFFQNTISINFVFDYPFLIENSKRKKIGDKTFKLMRGRNIEVRYCKTRDYIFIELLNLPSTMVLQILVSLTNDYSNLDYKLVDNLEKNSQIKIVSSLSLPSLNQNFLLNANTIFQECLGMEEIFSPFNLDNFFSDPLKVSSIIQKISLIAVERNNVLNNIFEDDSIRRCAPIKKYSPSQMLLETICLTNFVFFIKETSQQIILLSGKFGY